MLFITNFINHSREEIQVQEVSQAGDLHCLQAQGHQYQGHLYLRQACLMEPA